MAELIPPEEMLLNNISKVDERLNLLNQDLKVEIARTHIALAQVHATTALVAAVRELTAEVRKLRPS